MKDEEDLKAGNTLNVENLQFWLNSARGYQLRKRAILEVLEAQVKRNRELEIGNQMVKGGRVYENH